MGRGTATPLGGVVEGGPLDYPIRSQNTLRIRLHLRGRVADPEIVFEVVCQRVEERVAGVTRRDHQMRG